MNNDYLVSIGLCVRNGGDYLKGALDSLLGQTYKNFELIISDNASTDDTQKICEEYAARDKRIRYIRQKENIGSYGNYDFIRKEARGDYFAWAACDDFWHPRFIEACIQRFREDPSTSSTLQSDSGQADSPQASSGQGPGATMVFPNFCAFDDTGKIIKLSPEKYFPFAHDAYTRIKTYILNRAQNGKITMIYGLWKKRTPQDTLSLGDCHGDMIYVFRSLLAGYFANVPDVLFFKRGLVQSPLYTANKKLSLKDLADLPADYTYETLEEWHEIRKKIEKSTDLKTKIKNFLANRLQATKYSLKLCKYIFLDAGLTLDEKMRLIFWVKYAYLRAIFWYGYL